MNIHQELARAWQETVAAGRILNEFEASFDDPDHRWLSGDRIRFGLACTADSIQYAAWNLRTGEPIDASVDERRVGSAGFICQFNGYRGLRPGGAAQRLGPQPEISPMPADCRFYCQDPQRNLSLLRRDPLLQVELAHAHWNAYYNAAPIDKEGHFLWVPVDGSKTALPHFPQRLSREFMTDLVLLARYSAPSIVFFNALHAGASVNHIHAQSVFHGRRLAIEDARTVEYAGFTILDGYPAQALCFRLDAEAGALALAIDRLQEGGIPFNLMLLGEQGILFPRNLEHEIVPEFPGGVLSAMELAGRLITGDRKAYEHTGAAEIDSGFAKTTLSAKRLIDSWQAG
jgi:hypothetical protein